MNEQPDEDLRVDACEGKYTYIFYLDGSSKALRYGEPWIDDMAIVRGCRMTLALASDLDEARKEIIELRAMVEQGEMA
jgi:hypothetical protein